MNLTLNVANKINKILSNNELKCLKESEFNVDF